MVLAEELTRRQEKNPGYSMRAFAKQLGVSVSTLSEVLNGKRAFSKGSTFRVADRLFTCTEKRQSFLLSALGLQFSPEGLNIDLPHPGKGFDEIDVDQFKVISDWYHLAILSLAKTEKNSSDPSWIASRLGITKRDALAAFSRLIRLGLIAVDQDGFVRCSKPLFVKSKVPSTAIRKYHRENIEKALETLETTPVELRDYSSITMATCPEKIEQARELIRIFREQLSDLMESGDKNTVYTLAVQLFPVCKQEANK